MLWLHCTSLVTLHNVTAPGRACQAQYWVWHSLLQLQVTTLVTTLAVASLAGELCCKLNMPHNTSTWLCSIL